MKDLQKIAIIWGLILVSIFALLTAFALKWKAKDQAYTALEDKLVKATENYFEEKYTYPQGNNTVKITLTELKDNNLIDKLAYNDDECDGYVIINNNGVINYKGYIKCSKYMTKGYEN
jgi:hypothetical protein